MVPDLTELAGMRLERANAAAQAIPRFATLFGPPLAGVLIVALGPSNVLWFDAATFALSALLIALTIPSLPPAAQASDAPQGYRDALWEAWRFVRGDDLIFALMTTFALTNFLDAPSSLLFAVYAERRFGSAVTLGLMFAAFGGGALAGSICFGAVGHRVRRWPLFLVWLVGSLVAYGFFALRPSVLPLLTLLALWGLTLGSVNPLSATIYQERIPAALRGRVFGLMTSIGFLAIPIGRIVAGFTLDAFDMRWTFLGIAAGYVAIILVVLANRALRTMDRPMAPAISASPIRTPTTNLSD
jgi:predicted MFS family arabinose efflux permease